MYLVKAENYRPADKRFDDISKHVFFHYTCTLSMIFTEDNRGVKLNVGKYSSSQ